MTADLTRERLERMRDGYTATGIWTPDDMDALLAHALSEPARIAAARADAYEEGAQFVHGAHIRQHDRVRGVMGLDQQVGNHDWRHNPAYLIDTTDLRDAYDTLVVLVSEKVVAARAEGVREGIEMAAGHLEAKAADFIAERDGHMRAWENTKGGPIEEVHARRACSAEATAASARGWAAEVRALAPAPAPWTPTHRHYKGALYRVTRRGKRIWAGNDDRNGSRVVEYDNAEGGEFALADVDFDSEVEEGRRRYEPIAPAPPEAPTTPSEASDEWRPINTAPRDGTEIEVLAPGREGLSPIQCRCAWYPEGGFCIDELRQPLWWRPASAEASTTPTVEASGGWIEWTGGECPVQDGIETLARMRDGVIGRSLEPTRWCGWQHDPGAPLLDIIAYRIVKPAEASAPVAEGRMERAKAVIDRLEQHVVALEAENAKLREGLRPFAEAATHALEAFGADKSVTLAVLDRVAAYFVAWTHYRLARALLQGQGEAS